MQKLDHLKTCHGSTISRSLLDGLRLIRSLNENQAQDLVFEIEGNAFWASKGLFANDSQTMLIYLEKMNMLIQRRLDKGKLLPELDKDGLTLKRGSTALTLGEYQRVHLLNTDFKDLVSFDFCHAVFVDYETYQLLTYCEGDIVVKKATSLKQLILAVKRTIEWVRVEYNHPLVHETSLALAFKEMREANKK